jgi:hypothetical protein
MVILVTITTETVSAALASYLGILLRPDQLRLSRHDWRWMADLPDGRVVQIAPTAAAAARLLRERRLLATLSKRVTFSVPRPIGDVDAPLDLRAPAPGLTSTSWRWKMFATPARSGVFAGDMGRLLAELHSAFSPGEATRLSADPASLPWPMPIARLREHLSAVVPAPLRGPARRALDRYERLAEDDRDRVLVHGDVGAHNFTFDPVTHRVAGLFDFEEFALLDRHSDFKYVPTYGESVLRGATAAYEARTGVTLSLSRIRTFHAATALSFVVWRALHPEAKGMGRAGALVWLGAALLHQG